MKYSYNYKFLLQLSLREGIKKTGYFTVILIVRDLKNAFFMPFTPSLLQKYPYIMGAACAISEISIHFESGLRYFRNIFDYERLVLFQK